MPGAEPLPAGAPPAFAALAARRRRARLGHTVLWRPRVESTNDWARRLASGGAPEGVLAIADAQERGRGRHGRRWESPSGLGLYCSIVVRPRLPPAGLGLLTLAAGVAAAGALRRRCRVPAQLQWPNDLMAGGRKLGGILSETSVKGEGPVAAVVGWGLNLAQRREDFPAALRRRATSLRLEGADPVDRATLVESWLADLERRLASLERGSVRGLLRRFRSLSPTCEGAALLVELEGRRRRAVSRGLAPDGSLRIDLPEGRRVLRSADLLRVLEARTCCS